MTKKIFTILTAAIILINATNAFAEAKLNGFMSAQFGMSAEEVQANFKNDEVIFSSSETTDNDHLIYAQRKQAWITSELLYVFPAGSDRLALVIEIFPGLLDTSPIRKELTEKLGKPTSDNYPEPVLIHMQESNVIPEGVNQLAVWNITTDGIDREARMMSLNEYVRVEYIDNNLMAGK